MNALNSTHSIAPEGWFVASEYTKDLISGAIFETVMGNIDEGFAPYDMTICFNGSQYIPIHGNKSMSMCDTAQKAADQLLDYWNELPDGHKKLYKPPVEGC